MENHDADQLSIRYESVRKEREMATRARRIFPVFLDIFFSSFLSIGPRLLFSSSLARLLDIKKNARLSGVQSIEQGGEGKEKKICIHASRINLKVHASSSLSLLSFFGWRKF